MQENTISPLIDEEDGSEFKAVLKVARTDLINIFTESPSHYCVRNGVNL